MGAAGAQVIAAGYTSNFAQTPPSTPTPPATTLFDIDLATASLVQQNPPNNGTLVNVGLLSTATATTPAVTFTNVGEFDIAGGDDGLSLAALQPMGATQSSLYRVNLKTGATTLINTLGPAGSPLVTGLAIQLK
jgi:hypothetical protein